MHVEQLTGPVVYHGEGPVWSMSCGGLRWLDMLAGDIMSMGTDGSIGRRHVSSIAAAVRPRQHGGAVIAVERGAVLEDADGNLTVLPELWSDPRVRMNEGGCDPDGRFYCGSMAYDQTPDAGRLYRLNPDRSTQVVLDQVTVSNGLEWSLDGSHAYYNDTATFTISVFDYDVTSGLTNRRVFAEIPDQGRPDGLTLDREGGVWTAISNGGAVHRYGPNGKLEAVVNMPTPKVTACTFGGEDLDQLFITTSQENIDVKDEPLAGSLFSVAPDVQGLPVRTFAG